MLIPLTMACLLAAAARHELPPPVLVAVYGVEFGEVGKVSSNSNGTFDSGPLQVNSIWADRLARRYGLRTGETLNRLRDDGCFNVEAGAFILRDCIDRRKGDLWAGIACYHSATPARGTQYQRRIATKLVELYGPRIFAPR